VLIERMSAATEASDRALFRPSQFSLPGRGLLLPTTARRAIDGGAGASKKAGRQAGSGAHEPGGPHHAPSGGEASSWLTIF